MKKNLLQLITTCLCVVLLIVTLIQGKQIEELSQNLDNQLVITRQILQSEIQNISGSLRSELEESACVVLDSALDPVGIDSTTRQLLANATVTLKEWYTDTKVTLYAAIGEEKFTVEMTSDKTGTFTGPVALPLMTNTETIIKLDALITGGGITKQESLGAWGDVTMLLPLQSDGGGWSGPYYRNGVMNAQFHISITVQNSVPDSVNHPEFWIYKNGELAQQIPAVQDAYSSSYNGICYTTNTEGALWNIECDLGDVIDIRFRCEDAFGLGYDFLFAHWVAEEETGDNTQSAIASTGNSESLILYWP